MTQSFFERSCRILPEILLKETLWYRCFPVNFEKFKKTFLYRTQRHKNVTKRKSDNFYIENISFFAELAEDRFKDCEEYYKKYNEVFTDLAKKLSRKSDEIMLQHGEEILELYGKLEKLTRIDLRYISENDLPIPISYVIEMREEYENQRKFWKN